MIQRDHRKAPLDPLCLSGFIQLTPFKGFDCESQPVIEIQLN